MSLNPKEPGEVFYPQYTVVKTMPIKGQTRIQKGYLYTADGDGYLVAPGNDGFLNGIFQAQRDVPASAAGTADGADRVDCLCIRSRIGIKGTANLVASMRVRYDAATGKVAVFAIAGASPTKEETLGIVGSIYEIYTKTSLRAEKLKTADNDVVVVDLGVGL